MAVDLNGIRNVGDFVSQHYLDQLLEKDLKELLDTWAEGESAPSIKAADKTKNGNHLSMSPASVPLSCAGRI